MLGAFCAFGAPWEWKTFLLLLQREGKDIPAGDISCRESGSTLVIRLACLEEVAHAVHYAVWSVYGNNTDPPIFRSLHVGLLHDETH